VRTLIAIVIVSLVATSTAFARKASHHHFKRAAPKHQSATNTDPGGIARHPDDDALDRKIGSICRGCWGARRPRQRVNHSGYDARILLTSHPVMRALVGRRLARLQRVVIGRGSIRAPWGTLPCGVAGLLPH
jgi:hypothetical protein